MQRHDFIHQLTLALLSKANDHISIPFAVSNAIAAAQELEHKKIYFDQQDHIYDTPL